MGTTANKVPVTSTVPASAISIWTGSATVGGQEEINSEDGLTPGGDVVILRSPDTSCVDNTTPLYHKVCIFVLEGGCIERNEQPVLHQPYFS
jgi:hypothetical protein